MMWIRVRDLVPFDPESRIRDPGPGTATLAAGHFKHFKIFQGNMHIIKDEMENSEKFFKEF
jgi:hypothetical protein